MIVPNATHLLSQPDFLSSQYIRSVLCQDGYELRYRRWPALGSPEGTVILVNGMMGHAGWFRELAFLLTGLRLDVVGADRRGAGLNDRDRGDAPSSQLLISDLRRIIESEDRGLPIYLVGLNWGAAPVVSTAIELGRKLAGLVFLAPGLFPSPEIRQAMRRELDTYQGLDLDFPCLLSPLTPEMFSNRSSVCNFIRRDDLTQRTFTPRFFRISQEMSLVANARITQLTQPVLLLLAGKDETADNLQTLKAFQRLPRTLLTSATLNCRHGMQFENPHEIVMLFLDWLQCESQILAIKGFHDDNQQPRFQRRSER